MRLTTKLLLGATVVAGLSISAFAACASDVDFGSTDGTNGKSITGLNNPVNAQDAATKKYVDTNVIGVREVHTIPYSVDGDMNLSIAGGLSARHIRVHIFSYSKTPYMIECSGYADSNVQTFNSCVTLSNGMNGSLEALSGTTLNLKWSGAWGNTAAWNAKVIVYK